MIEIKNLRNIEFESIEPKLKEELTQFCKSLDKDEFPEATLICSGKSKTLANLGKIYQKLKGKKEKKTQRKLKEAENMIMNLNRLHHPEYRGGRDAAITRIVSEVKLPRLGAQGEISTIMEMARELVRETAQKIKQGEALTREEAIAHAQISYRLHQEKRGTKNPISNEQTQTTIIMCSDARNVVGEIVFDTEIATQSRAGNTELGERINSKTIIVLGHKGYGGCGAVNGACACHQKGEKFDDPDMRAITTDHIPKEVTTDKNPAQASEANIMHQVQMIQKQNPGKKVIGIIADIENKNAKIIAGENSEVAQKICKSIEQKLQNTGDMKKQTAGFVIAARENRVVSAKAALEVEANEVFEINFKVGDRNKVEIPQSAQGSAKFATGNVGSVKDSKLIVVMDPIIEVAKKAAQILRESIPGATVIAMHEDVKNGELVEITN